jgi:proline dehydrogenase
MAGGIFGRVVVSLLPIMPKFVIGWVARRYVAGKDLDSAVKAMKKLELESACTTVDVLGEEISSLEEADFFVEEYKRVILAINKENLDANISIKPTAFGLLLNREKGLENISKICELAAKTNIFVRLDMEDHRVTQDTIDVVLEMHSRNITNVGCVLQSRLFRTKNDIKNVCKSLKGYADFRLCKGIYLEPSEISHTSYQSIVDSFCSDIDLALDLDAYVGIASHDLKIINYAQEVLKSRNLGPGLDDVRANSPKNRVGKGQGYEFQFLLGVRGNIRRKLASEGHLTRVYIPYGGQWYEYSMRRLRENPDIAWHVFKAMIFPWSNRR